MKPHQKRPEVTGSAPVIFLFNHDAGHQVAHLAGIAGAFALQANGVRAVIAFGSETIKKEVQKLLSPEQIAALEWQSLALPEMLRALTKDLNRLLPVHRLMRLYFHRRFLRQCSAIISTERTCLTLKRHWSRFRWHDRRPAFILVPHGSGDGSLSVHPALGEFDLLLVSGKKVQDQFMESGIATADQFRIIGYTKFDILRGRFPEKFFGNDNPTFLYNPHFDPHLSSWFDHGADILEYFFQNPDRYNLIFAPHVMLFYKKVHISPVVLFYKRVHNIPVMRFCKKEDGSRRYRLIRKRPDIDPKYFDAPNIRIDVDSARLFDMSYTLSADVYIGDVSSQVYEFLYRPRACFFIDTHSVPSPGAMPEYDFWNNGPVARTAKQLLPLLPDHAAIALQYRTAQEQRMAYTADQSDPRPASERGAEAISHFVESLNTVAPA
ncbi:hypothetical protein [Sphingorhabdus sp.]|uniref:hypothetical protein n=1 Tax=Sphingorhabdus sp. TaxID=1902408 RepID=UPI0037C86054